MILTPNELQLFLAKCKEDIDAVNYALAIIDDSQMANDIAKVRPNENLLLYGVLPDYGGDYRDADAAMYDNGVDFLILKKAQHSTLSNTQLMDDMEETLQAVREFITLIFQEKNNPNTCPTFYFFKEGSERITPVWSKAGTNGYMVSFNLRTFL